MAHAIPDAPGVAFAAVEVIAVEQSVLVPDGLLQWKADSAMSADDEFRLFFLHDNPPKDERVSR